MGEVRVPAAALYKAQTQRAVENFPISGRTDRAVADPRPRPDQGCRGRRPTPSSACCRQDIADAIVAAAAAVAANEHDDEFPIDVFQTGSGTSSNMNTNEVIASLAALGWRAPERPRQRLPVEQRRVPQRDPHRRHRQPDQHDLIPALEHLAASLEAKADEFAEVVKSGRTHLMDATPVTLGQEFGGYAAQIRYGIERVQAALPRVAELPLGGTAVGTGINTPPGFAAAVIATIAEQTGLPLTEARNHFEAQGARDGLVEASGRAAHHRRQPEQDRQRPALDGFRSACRSRRDRAAGPAAGLLDHAGQGEPGAVRGDPHGLRPGDRQRRGRRLRRRVGQLRAERDAAGDGPQPAGVDPPARQRRPGCWPTGASTASRPTSSTAASWPSPRRRSSPR